MCCLRAAAATTQNKRLSLFYDGDIKSSRNHSSLPALLDQLSFIFSGGFIPGGEQNRISKVGFIGNLNTDAVIIFGHKKWLINGQQKLQDKSFPEKITYTNSIHPSII